MAMEVASLSCYQRRLSRKTSEPLTRKAQVIRNANSDSDESDDSGAFILRTDIRRTSRVRSEAMDLTHEIYVKMKRHGPGSPLPS